MPQKILRAAIVLLIVVVVFLVSCAAPTPTQAPDPTPTEWQQPGVYRIQPLNSSNTKTKMTKAQLFKHLDKSLEYLIFPFKALTLIAKSPKLLKLSFISFLINIIVFIGALALLNTYSKGIIESLSLGEFILDSSALRIFLTLIRLFLIFVALAVIYILVAIPINSPIYALMINEVFRMKRIETNPRLEVKNVRTALRRIGYSLVFELKKAIVIIFVFIANFAFSFAVNFVPVVGQVVIIIIQLLILGFFGSIDIFEPMHTNALYRFRSRMMYVFRKPYLFPFSILGGIFISIPIINVLALPIFIISGILIWLDDHNSNKLK